jgi:hypothetical protein
MANCSAGPRRCKVACTGGCSCTYVHATDSCICECYDSNVGGMNQALSVGAKIDVSISGLELGQVAARFDKLLAREVMVPASRSRQRVRLRLKGVSFSTALKALGLVTRAPAPKRSTRAR